MSNLIEFKTTFVSEHTMYKTLTERVNTFVVNLPNEIISFGNPVPRALSLLTSRNLVAAGHASARFLLIPEM